MAVPIPRIQDPATNEVFNELWLNKTQANINLVFRGTVTGTGAVEIFVDGIVNKRIVLPQDSCISYVAKLAAIATDFSSGAGGVAQGSITNLNGTVAAVANGTVVTYPTASPAVTLAVVADNTNKALTFTVAGTAAKTHYCEITVELSCASNPDSLATFS